MALTKTKVIVIGILGLVFYGISSLDDELAVEVIGELRSAGAVVQAAGLVLATDCLKQSDMSVCQNFSNVDVLYFSGMLSCPRGEDSRLAQCLESNDRPVPLIRNALAWELGQNEAVVLYGPMPPTETHFGKNLIHYERHVSRIPDPEGYIPLQPGENPPPRTMADRRVIDASIGDTLNNHFMRRAPSPENSEQEIFAVVVSGNQVVMEQTIKGLVSGGIPEDAINRLSIPDNYVLGSDVEADTFRLVGRIARPFDEEKMAETLSPKNYKFWRVSFPKEPTEFVPYPVPDCESVEYGREMPPAPCHRPRHSAQPELTEAQMVAYRGLQEEMIEKFGKPDRIIMPGYREYNDEICSETGSYCWGNNNDALYVNIDEEDGTIVTFDFSGADSKLVIVGIDHQAANWADTWNLGFFTPEGVTLGSLSFADIQKYEYPDMSPALSGLGFYLQLKSVCGEGDEYCYEINFREGEEKLLKIMNRIYVNPRTGTGPAGEQTVLPVIYSYH